MKRIFALLIVCVVFIAGAFPCSVAQAQSVEQIIPTFGLYCEDSNVIQSGAVTFDITDTEMLAQGIGIKKSEYKVLSNQGKTEFIVPFISSASNTPDIDVTVNGKSIHGTVWYGDTLLQNNGYFIDNIYSPVLDEEKRGTFYTVIPDDDTVTIELSFSKQNAFIYETTNDVTRGQTSGGSYMWTMKNALAKQEICFYVLGDSSEHTFASSSGYRAKKLSCKEFIDSQYAVCLEYYGASGDVSVEFFYSLANMILKSNANINYDELFYNSVNQYRFNAYKFSVSLENESAIYYELPISIQRNYDYKPTVYCVEQKQFSDYLTSYVVELNFGIPYMIESNIDAVQEGTNYCANSADGFRFAFGSSKTPIKAANLFDGKVRVILTVICITAGSVALACTILLIFLGVRKNKVK